MELEASVFSVLPRDSTSRERKPRTAEGRDAKTFDYRSSVRCDSPTPPSLARWVCLPDSPSACGEGTAHRVDTVTRRFAPLSGNLRFTGFRNVRNQSVGTVEPTSTKTFGCLLVHSSCRAWGLEGRPAGIGANVYGSLARRLPEGCGGIVPKDPQIPVITPPVCPSQQRVSSRHQRHTKNYGWTFGLNGRGCLLNRSGMTCQPGMDLKVSQLGLNHRKSY